MSISSSKNRSIREKLLILGKMFNYQHVENHPKTGFIFKFNNSIDFKKVSAQISDNGLGLVPPVVDCPSDYCSPWRTLLNGCYFLNKDNEIATFVVNKKRIYHSDKRYSYNTLDMMIRFQNYLYKVIPDIKIEFSFENDYAFSEKELVLSRFVLCLSESFFIDNECSVSKPTKKKDIVHIQKFFKNLGYDTKFTQYYCKTCESYGE